MGAEFWCHAPQMLTKRLAQVAAVAVLLAGCGDGDGGYDDAASVAKAAGCTQVKKAEPEAYVADAVSCKFNGHSTTVSWFRGQEAFKNWLNAASASGTTIISGPNWAIECESKADCDAMKKNAS